MVLYTCEMGKAFGQPPGPLAHPCARAAKALDKAGHDYEHRTVKGGSLKPWTWPSRAADRAEVKRISGQQSVPVLILDDGEVIIGSGTIATWARSRRSARSATRPMQQNQSIGRTADFGRVATADERGSHEQQRDLGDGAPTDEQEEQ